METHVAIVGLKEIAQLLGVREQTAYGWNAAKPGRGRVLPPPDLQISGTPAWLLRAVIDWAAASGRPVDAAVVAEIRERQAALFR